jgi:hypothetical protein
MSSSQSGHRRFGDMPVNRRSIFDPASASNCMPNDSSQTLGVVTDDKKQGKLGGFFQTL